MQRLVCDVGGTNVRLGRAVAGVLTAGSVRSFANDDFGEFPQVVDAYLRETGHDAFTDIAIAVAGPVSATTARLTNRNWHFDAQDLSARFGAPVHLLNDLAALGASLSKLGPDDLLYVSGQTGVLNGQKLVIGIGTGFNVSPVISRAGHAICPEVEFGHVAMPQDIAALLAERAPDMQAPSVEELFSGRGYKAFLHSGGSLTDYAAAMGLLAGNLLMAFLPRDGIYFAGGVARHVLQSGGVDAFSDAWTVDRALGLSTAVSCILDDAAALKGCAQYEPPHISGL